MDSHSQIAAIYALLGRIFISEMDRQSLDALRDREVSSVFEKLQSGFQDYLNNSDWDDERLEQLASDYCHLFILPGKSALPLRASHWMAGEEANTIEQLELLISGFKFDGLATDPAYANLPHDHLGVLLYFLSSVYASEDSEIQRLGPSIAGLALQPWIFRFGERLIAGSSNPLYVASGRLLLELQGLEGPMDAQVA